MTSGPPIPPKGILNGPVYETAKFTTKYLNVPPNLHRLRNAVGLTVGLYLGRKMMDIIVGETPDGRKIDKESLPFPLRPLHGVLAYNHFSDDPKDRWMKVFDLLVPGVMGGVGAAMGSASFFKDTAFKPVDTRRGWPAEKIMLSDAEHRALMDQARPWGALSGSSAVFGSASGFGLFPSPVNYSASLGTVFTMRAGRTMANPVLRPLFNSHSSFPFRPTKLVNRMIDYVVGNPSAHPEKLEEYARGIIKPWFNHVSEEQIQAFANIVKQERNKFLGSGASLKETEKKVHDALRETLSDFGLEKTLIKIGLDPREAAIGDMGFISTIAHIAGDAMGMNVSKKLEETQALLRKGLEVRHPELVAKPFIPIRRPNAYGKHKILAAAGFLGLGTGTLYAITNAKDTSVCDLNPDESTAASCTPAQLSANDVTSAHRHIVHSKKRHGFFNTNVLDTAEGITGMLNASIGLHRIHCAAGLTVGSWLGDEVMKALTGIKFDGAPVKKEDVLKPLQKFYKAMAFNPHSDLPADKWIQVLRWGIPGVIGALAVVQGSKMFFHPRKEETKHADYLDEAESKATFEQSRPWSYTAAITSLFGYPSGLPMLPLVNYSTNLGTRFSMASGRKVSLPFVGKVWSNNSTLFPFGPPGMVNLLIREAVNNKNFNPEMLETYSIGILKPWFKNVTPGQVEAFVTEVYKVRDQFFKEGGVPEEMKAQLEKELAAHFKGAGLEDTLTHIGLDPLKADIGSNGWSAAIAGVLGAKKNIEKIKADFTESFRKRHEKASSKPDTPGLPH